MGLLSLPRVALTLTHMLLLLFTSSNRPPLLSFFCLPHSTDRELLYGGTLSGDFLVVRVKSKAIVATIPACRQGVFR